MTPIPYEFWSGYLFGGYLSVEGYLCSTGYLAGSVDDGYSLVGRLDGYELVGLPFCVGVIGFRMVVGRESTPYRVVIVVVGGGTLSDVELWPFVELDTNTVDVGCSLLDGRWDDGNVVPPIAEIH